MNRIKALREQRGWSQARLGKELNCAGISISRYEAEQRGLDAETIHRLCDIFDCTADYLLGRSSMPSAELSPQEESFLRALRRADDRALDVVAVALAPFREESSSSVTA